MMVLFLLLACGPDRSRPTDWDVWALDYGRSRFEMGGERVPFAWQTWLLRGRDRTILVDTGFARADVAEAWGIQGFRPVPELLAAASVAPSEVTDVVITHGHWDHAGNLAPYDSAEIWIQEAELTWMRGRVRPDRPERSGVRLSDLSALDAAGERLRVVAGDATIAEGVTLHRSGHHTPGCQWVEIEDGDRTLVLASDIAPLFTHLETGLAPPTSQDAAADQGVIASMIDAADPDRLAIPGHDPLVFERFATVHNRIVTLR